MRKISSRRILGHSRTPRQAVVKPARVNKASRLQEQSIWTLKNLTVFLVTASIVGLLTTAQFNYNTFLLLATHTDVWNLALTAVIALLPCFCVLALYSYILSRIERWGSDRNYWFNGLVVVFLLSVTYLLSPGLLFLLVLPHVFLLVVNFLTSEKIKASVMSLTYFAWQGKWGSRIVTFLNPYATTERVSLYILLKAALIRKRAVKQTRRDIKKLELKLRKLERSRHAKEALSYSIGMDVPSFSQAHRQETRRIVETTLLQLKSEIVGVRRRMSSLDADSKESRRSILNMLRESRAREAQVWKAHIAKWVLPMYVLSLVVQLVTGTQLPSYNLELADNTAPLAVHVISSDSKGRLVLPTNQARAYYYQLDQEVSLTPCDSRFKLSDSMRHLLMSPTEKMSVSYGPCIMSSPSQTENFFED